MKTLADAIKDLEGVASRVSSTAPYFWAAGEVRLLLQDHYTAKQAAEPNRLGGKRTNFWADVARSVGMPQPAPGNNGARITIGDPRISHKILGGRITAKRTRFLTIPIHPDAHGRRAVELERALGVDLFVLQGGTNAVLAASRDGEVTAYYALKRSVTQKPWPGSLPDEAEIAAAVSRGIDEYLTDLRTRN